MDSMGHLLQLARQINTGMSQAEAAQAAGFKSKVYWSQIEAGIKTPPTRTGARMARVVGLTPAQLRKAGQEDAADELAEILEMFGPYVGDGADRELVARVGALSEEQRSALFTLLKMIPTIPIDLAILFHWRPRSAMIASATGAAAALAAALAVWLPGPPPTEEPAQPDVSETQLKRGPSAEALRPSPPLAQRGPSGSPAPGAPGGGRSHAADLQLEASTVKVRASVVPPLPSLPVPAARDLASKGTTPVVGPATPGGGKTGQCAGTVAARLVARVCSRLPLG